MRGDCGSREPALVAEFVSDPPAGEKVTAPFREKYGFPDQILSSLRGGTPKIMRLRER